MSNQEVDDFLAHYGVKADYPSQETLAHYGVLGMKWGRRKNRASRPSIPSSDDHIESRELAKKPLHTMSNQEIQKFVQRISLEKQYLDATANKSALTKGQATVKRILSMGKQAEEAYKLYNSDAGKAAVLLVKNLSKKAKTP